MNVVPVTIGAPAPTKDTLASLTWREPARLEACSAPSMMCRRPRMRPVPKLPPKGVERQFAVELDAPVLDEIERLAFLERR
jgi:hypothetical protein